MSLHGLSIEFCPPRCKQGEIQCARSFDCNGKPLESDICIPEFTDSSQTCNNHCPTYCYPDEQFCNGNILEDGCKNPDFCIKKYADGPHGQLCPVYCPAYCSAVEKLCNGELLDGCRGADFCVPIECNFNFMISKLVNIAFNVLIIFSSLQLSVHLNLEEKRTILQMLLILRRN